MSEVCTLEEQRVIVAWADAAHPTFRFNGQGRCYAALRDRPDAPPCVWDIRERIVERECLRDVRAIEVYLRDLVSYVSDGGKIHPHTDPNEDGLVHTRFNVFVQLPERGGEPIYAGKRVEWRERHYVRCVAGRDRHECAQVFGQKARISLSFGFYMPPERIT